MRFKKLIAATMTAALVFVLFTIPVSAHHGHDGNGGHHESDGYSSATEPDCPPCTVDGCTEYGRHTHDGCEYNGHTCPPCTVDGCTEYGQHTHDGCEYYGYACPPCTVDGCTEYGRHSHDGCEYNGYGCPPCTVDECAEYGRHSHDGYEYCGYDHKYGYCDGSCETAFCKDRTDRGQHGGRHHRQ